MHSFDTHTPKELITTYLEMTDSRQFKPSFSQLAANVRIEQMQTPDLKFYLYLYQAVGENLRWRDRLYMSPNELRSILGNPNTSVYILYVSGVPAGYVELDKQANGAVEIAYFGLREEFHGQGLGKHLLSYGIQKAWQIGARRVWVHTCNLDGEHALSNYEKRGFKVYQRHVEQMPERYS